MGSYLQKHKNYLNKPHEESKVPEKSNEFDELFLQIFKMAYGEKNISGPKIVENHSFIAYQNQLVFDLATSPSSINADKIKTALTNNYITEVVYFVPDRILLLHPRISYRYIADYVKILQANNRSDLVRWVNAFRNKVEEDYERNKKLQSIAEKKKNA